MSAPAPERPSSPARRHRHDATWSLGGPPRAGARAVAVGLSALIVVTLGAGAWEIAHARATLRQQLVDQELSLAHVSAHLVDAGLAERLRLVESFASRPSLEEQMALGRWEQAVEHLRDLVEIDPQVRSASLLGPTARIRARIPHDPSVIGRDMADRREVRQTFVVKRGALSPGTDSAGRGSRVVSFAAPIRNPGGTVLGVLLVDVPVTYLDPIVDHLELPLGSTLTVFDANGHPIAGRGAGAAADAVDRALTGDAGAAELPMSRGEGDALVAFAPVPRSGWAVVIERPLRLAYRPLRLLTLRLVIVSSIVAVFAVATAGVLVRLIRRNERQRRQSIAVLRSIADGAVVTDRDCRIVAVNPAMEELVGSREEDLLGKQPEVFPLYDSKGEPLPSDRQPVRQAIATGRAVLLGGFGITVGTRDGRRVPVTVAAAPISDQNGEIIGAVEMIRDVSDQWELDQMRNSFVATVSHELRTPLTLIRGFSELLEGGALSGDDARQALARINEAAQRLSRLIDDLLSVARLEGQTQTPNITPLALPEVLEEAIAPFAGERHISIELDPVAHEILADRDMLIQILTNLVSNAVKYSPPEAAVSVSAARADASVEISVADRGYGLTEDQVAKLFEKFFRAEHPRLRRKVPGTGLGLYITRELVRLHGGEIRVESKPGEGTTFTFSLPLVPAGASEPAR